MSTIAISPQSVFSQIVFSDREEALKHLADSLKEQGFVKEEYFKFLLEREQKSPTGLSMGTMGVAIPHTDPQYVNQDSVAVAVLEKPVIFKDMLTSQEDIEVRVIFLLGLSEGTKHLNILRQIMNLLKNEGSLEEILKLNQEELVSFLQTNLKIA